MGGRPSHRVLQEAPHLDQGRFGEIRPVAAGLQHVPPGAEVVQLDLHLAQGVEAAGEHPVEQHHEGVVDDGTGVAQRLAELDLGGAVGGEVFHQQGALAFRHVALDQRVAAESLRLFAHIGHRGHHPVGDPGGEGNARGLAAGHHLDVFVADVPADLLHAELADLGASAGKIDDAPAVDIDRRLPARSKGIGFLGTAVDGLDFQQDACRCQSRVAVPVGCVAASDVEFRHGVLPVASFP